MGTAPGTSLALAVQQEDGSRGTFRANEPRRDAYQQAEQTLCGQERPGSTPALNNGHYVVPASIQPFRGAKRCHWRQIDVNGLARARQRLAQPPPTGLSGSRGYGRLRQGGGRQKRRRADVRPERSGGVLPPRQGDCQAGVNKAPTRRRGGGPSSLSHVTRPGRSYYPRSSPASPSLPSNCSSRARSAADRCGSTRSQYRFNSGARRRLRRSRLLRGGCGCRRRAVVTSYCFRQTRCSSRRRNCSTSRPRLPHRRWIRPRRS